MIKELQLVRTQYAERYYWDYVISGQPLWQYLKMLQPYGVTPFGFFPNQQEQMRALKEFRVQQKTYLADSRIMLYICTCCGDIGCGAVTAKIIDKGSQIIWTKFASQDAREAEGIYIIPTVPDLIFDRAGYFKALSVVGKM